MGSEPVSMRIASQDFIRHELVALAAASRSLMASMLRNDMWSSTAVKTPIGGFGVALGRTAAASGIADFRWTGFIGNGAAAAPDTSNDRWTIFKRAAGEKIITVLRARIADMPSGLKIRFWVNDQGEVITTALVRSSGDPEIDDIVDYQVLRTMEFKPPPPDLKMPLTLSVIIGAGAWLFALDEASP